MQIHWPLVVSTACQRVGLGLFICAFVGAWLADFPVPLAHVALITLGFLAVGGIASIFHLQRPARFFNAFSNLKSHLTQEALITPFLGIGLLVCGFDGLLYSLGDAAGAVGLVTALLAAAFLVCTGLAYQMGSRPAWNTPFVLVLFLLTALGAGTLGVAALWALCGSAVPPIALGMALSAVILCVACQGAYVRRMRSVGYGVDVNALEAPYRDTFMTWVITGAVVPLVALGLFWALPAMGALWAFVAWASFACGIGAWTVLFFKGAHKVKMFPMYPVDLNLDM